MSLAALISHDKFCCLLQMRPDILPEGALNRRLRSERPEKKIAIQIRKDYKKSMIPLSPNRTNNSGEHKQNQITFKVPKIPKEQEKENQRKIEIMMSEFCNIECLTCIPCAKRYQSITALKRHASLHFNWTRFTCSLCKFRSYHKYETVRHTISDHNVDEHSAASTIMDDESFGPLRYFLDSEDDNSLSSDADELDSHGSHSRSTSASSGKISASCLNDNKNCNEKPEGTTENIKPPLVIKKSVNKSNAKDNISNEIPNMTSSEKKEGDDMVIESKLSDCVKIQNVEESEKVSYFQDESKTLVTGESTDSILDPSTDSAKFVSENVNRNLTQTDTTKNSTSGSQEDLNNSIIVLSFTDTQESDKGKLVQVDNESSKTILSVNNKNNEITNSSSESNIMKGNPNLVKPYPLRGQTDSSGHKNQIAEETEEGRFERPQRLRRSIEQKDFIYDTKRSGFQKLETEIGKRSITPKKGLERKFEDRPGTRRRNSSPRSEMPTKKMKIVNDGSPHETCNGTASQLLVQNKRIPTQPDTLIKGRNTQLPVTKGKDSNSSHQLPQMKQQHVNEELQGNSDNDDCSIPNKVENENIYETNKSNGNHNNSKPVSLITGANNDKLNIEEQEECNTSFISQSIENNILETEPQKKVMGTKLPDKDSEENIVVCPHIFENGKDQENNDTDKEEDEKGTRTHQHDNCKEMLWETGKEKKFVKDINTEEQKNSFADNKEHIKCTSS
ncbi:putative myb-like protein X-like 1 [Homarus americanus]|uniref:Putative myb-like protein X-like 1 n=1 Tax=Homarus americanus TaxID=6706 RepID=A0A8J5MTZ8_HOMAM|nr:putative myb-like protein X-like 1 [Homarus americanus]